MLVTHWGSSIHRLSIDTLHSDDAPHAVRFSPNASNTEKLPADTYQSNRLNREMNSLRMVKVLICLVVFTISTTVFAGVIFECVLRPQKFMVGSSDSSSESKAIVMLNVLIKVEYALPFINSAQV